ncbi:MAG TPA: hypothetical protein VED37_14800, partial [Ktedonobacteraceae bacterium]|nr:hypothetical protein [Ktedonobacteraceae bacterium]
LVATRTFIYWLDAFNCIPNIFNGFVSECGLMQRILSEFPAGTTHLGWFINEPLGVKFTSKAAMPVLASDFFENLEVWTSVQTVGTGLALSSTTAPSLSSSTAPSSSSATTSQPAPSSSSGSLTSAAGSTASEPGSSTGSASSSSLGSLTSAGAGPAPSTGTVSYSTPKAYVSFTISDGDNLQYNQHRMLALWKDPARGTLPIGWTISPSLVQTAPSLATYYISSMTANDELIAGPSGVGYIYPSQWPQAQLPAFLNVTGQTMQAMKLALIEVLDSGLGQAFVNPALQTTYVDVLAPFGVKGILSGSGQLQSTWKKISGVPVLQNLGLGDSVSKTVSLIQKASAQYLNVYIMAWSMTPTNLQQVVQQLGNQYQIVKPSSLLAMLP